GPEKGGLELWDGSVTRIVGALSPPAEGPLLAVDFDRTATRVLACGVNGHVQAWSLPDLRRVADWQSPGKVTAVAFTSDVVALGDQQGLVVLHQPDGQVIRKLPSRGSEVRALAWSPVGETLAIGTR